MYKLVGMEQFRKREVLDLGSLATFVPNKKLPVYNWLYYKEGFSRDIVLNTLQHFGIKEGKTVLDPFCGSGTTNLACKQLGIDSVGFDVLPLCVFVSKVKTRNYDIDKLKRAAGEIVKAKFSRPFGIENRISGFARRYFSRFTLEDAIFYRNKIMEIDDRNIRDFLLLALIVAAMKCSYAMKDGSVIKIQKRHVPPLKIMLRRQINSMLSDLENFETKPCKTTIDYGDARFLKLENETMDSIITSPPYLNKIEYTDIYRIEEELFMPHEEKPGIRSFIGIDETKIDKTKFIEMDFELPIAAKPYFHDMNMAIKEMFRVCAPGARIAVIVGDGYLQEQVVPSGELLCVLAEKAGFKVNEIVIMSRRVATTPSRHKVGDLNESLLLWEKET